MLQCVGAFNGAAPRIADMFSSPVSPIYFILAITIALATLKMLSRWVGIPQERGRYATIDGLRGYLALMVFIHHACIWYFKSHGEAWKLPPSHLYSQLGQGSVVLFFMITGFLFFGRIRRSGPTGPDWLQLAVSRVLRLMPLYYVALAIMILGVFALTGWELREPLSQFIAGLLRWLSFTIAWGVPLNGSADTDLLLAGVFWSLPYEWCFYACLPLVALLTGRRPPWWAIAVGIMGALLFWHRRADLAYLCAFACGMATAVITERSGMLVRRNQRWPDLLILALLTVLVAGYRTSAGFAQVLILGVVFCLIASGASLFGALVHPISILFGEMAYGIYLLHGLLLYSVFGAGPGQAGLDVAAHWASALALVPALIGLCWLAHRGIERPAMNSVPGVVAWIRRR